MEEGMKEKIEEIKRTAVRISEKKTYIEEAARKVIYNLADLLIAGVEPVYTVEVDGKICTIHYENYDYDLYLEITWRSVGNHVVEINAYYADTGDYAFNKFRAEWDGEVTRIKEVKITWDEAKIIIQGLPKALDEISQKLAKQEKELKETFEKIRELKAQLGA